MHITGLLLCVLVFLGGFLLKGNLSLYFNLTGFLIVIGGTAAAALLSFTPARLAIVFRVLTSSYRRRIKSEEEIVKILIDLSIKSRVAGILSLQEDESETSILFLRRALGCLVDNYDPAQIRDILNTEMYFFKLRREDAERVLRTIGDFFPAFGIIGSVVGLVSMLGGIGDTSIILTAIPVALTSTLYGLIFANFFFVPFAANLRERTNQELLLQKIIMEGVIAIESELNPTILKTKLYSFLTPAARQADLVPLARIRERFQIEPQNNPDSWENPEENPPTPEPLVESPAG